MKQNFSQSLSAFSKRCLLNFNHVLFLLGAAIYFTLPLGAMASSAPTVTTGTPSDIGMTSADIGGSVNPNGLATTYWFQWGTTTSYGNIFSEPYFTLPAQNTKVGIGPEPLTGLSQNTTYHYRLDANNSDGTTYGPDQSFTTLSSTPIVSTTAATGVTTSEATLTGTVNPNGSTTTVYFEWGTTTSYGNTTSSVNEGSGSSTINVNAPLTSLSSGTLYHYQLVASNSGGTSTGGDQTFTTVSASAPVTFTPTDMATLNGAAENSITLAPNSNLSGSFPYLAVDGSNAGGTMTVLVGLVNSANQWVGGEPQVVYSAIPSAYGSSGTATWSSLQVPASSGTYELWFQVYLTANTASSISAFESNPPTVSGYLSGVVATIVVQGNGTPPSFTPTDTPTLNSMTENTITLTPSAELTGSFPYLAAVGSSPGQNMVTIVGFVNNAAQWVGGTPLVVYNAAPSQGGNNGTASWSNLTAPSTAGTYQLWFQTYLTTEAGPAINSFEYSPPTTAGYLSGIVATVEVGGTNAPQYFTSTAMATLNGTIENSITLAPSAGLTGSFPYIAGDGSSPGQNMVTIVGFENNAGQWVGGTPQVVYNAVPSQSGSAGTASWSNLAMPPSAGTYQLWFQTFTTANTSSAVNQFESSPPTASGYLSGIVGTAIVQGNTTTPQSSVFGVVYNSSGQPISGASVQAGNVATTSASDGSYSVNGLTAGNYPATISAPGYTTIASSLTVPTTSQAAQNLTLVPSGSVPKVTSITTTYNPNGTTAIYFVNGVSHSVLFTANVDWGGHPAQPGVVKFITPNQTYSVNTSGSSASYQLDVGTAFNVGGQLQVQAVSSDGSSSAATVAPFIVMSAPLSATSLKFVDEGNHFYYQSQEAMVFQWLNDTLPGGADIDTSIPLFGGNPVDLKFSPNLTAKITGPNLSFFQLQVSAGSGSESSDETELDENDPDLDIADLSLDLGSPAISISAVYNSSLQTWTWGGSLTISPNVNVPLGADAGLVLVGPVPVLLYADANLNLSANANLNILNLSPISWSGTFELKPTISGSMGAISVASAVGSVSGSANFNFQYPQTPHLNSYGVTIDANVTIYVLIWSVANYPLEWTWNSNENSIQPALKLVNLNQSPSFRPYPRDYLNRPAYGTFNGTASTGASPAIHPLGMQLGSPNPLLYALQSDVFPFSEPSISANGTNLYAVWLYDNTNRTVNNETMLVSSEYNGTNWSMFTPVADDGTADFHPQLRTFSDGSAVVAWENEGTVIPTNADFTAMITNLEIATAFYNPATAQWQPMQQLTKNNYLDQSPRIDGPSENNLMLVWVANTNNDLQGSATNPNELWYATWNGSAWSSPQVFASVPYPLLKYDMTYDGTNAYVVMSLDADNTLTNLNAHELFEVAYQNGTWSNLYPVSTNQGPNDDPHMAIDPNGNIVLVWLQGNVLASVTNFNFANKHEIGTNLYSANLANYQLAESSNGRLAIVWAAPSSENPSDVWAMFYDPNYDVWGSPRQLTDVPQTEMDLASTFYGTNQLVALYDLDSIAIGNINQNESVITNSDLYVLDYQLTNDLALITNSMSVSPPNPAPNSTVTLSVLAANLGDSAVSNVLVAFYQGNPTNGGTEIGQTNLAVLMAPGATNLASIPWTVPATTNSISVYAEIDPNHQYPDSNLSNNETSNTFVESYVMIQSVTWGQITSNMLSVTATVVNQGTIASQPANVSFLLNSLTGTTLFSTNVASLLPGQSVDVNFVWNASNVANGLGLFATINGSANALETTIQPNITEVSLQLGQVTMLSSGTAQFNVTCLSGQSYVIQASTNLVNWVNIATNSTDSGSLLITDPNAAQYSVRFYRVMQQ
jgi:hypothetical protein